MAMEYRPLGNTDIKVSSFGLGVMTFGAQTQREDAFRQLDMALAAGINFFDTAENYPSPLLAITQGESERILGEWIAARGARANVVVATKVTGPGNRPGDLTHIRGASRRLDRANIAAAVDASLRRLNTDYIDLYQVHWSERIISTLRRSRFSLIPDEEGTIAIEETLAALAEQVSAGKIRHVGVCNESPWGVMRYLAAAESNGLPRLVSIQNGYSLMDRYFEIGVAEVAVREKVGLIGYSPLASGLLSGKYSAGVTQVEGSRSANNPAFAARFSPRVVAALEGYTAIAREHGISLPHMALAFARQQPFVTSVLMAASRVEQLQRNLESVDITLSKEVIKAINAIHDENPNPA